MPFTNAAAAFRLLAHHPAVRAFVATAAGFGEVPCHLVGGVLRDRLLGLPAHDYDVVVAGHGREIALALAASLPARFVHLGGKEFAAYRLVGEDFVLDLWDRASRSLDEDLARRDFTVDSIAYDLKTAEVVDPFDGTADLARRLLRATTPESFLGDPLRVLRLPRLTLQLPGFAAEPATLALARESAPALVWVAAERVRDELDRIFASPDAHRGLALLAALDLYPGLWLGRPGEPSEPEDGKTAAAMREIAALAPALRALRAHAPEAADTVVPGEARVAHFAALFRHLPAVAGALAALERFRDAGYMPHKAAAQVAALLALPGLPGDDLSRRRFLHAMGPGWATAAVALGARAAATGEAAWHTWRAELPPLAELARREGESLFAPPRLLSGDDLQTLSGLPPGPEIGRLANALRAAQVDGLVRTRDEAVELIRRLAPSGA